jgi:tetratricopeptide (TPR) repeat protein
MTKRRRLLLLTASFGVIFVAGAAGITTRVLARDATYRPGERVEGLTEDLARSLPADHPRVTFVDATRSARISFTHFSGTRTSQLPEDMGSGVAWGDFDDDGWEDLAVANEAGPMTMSEGNRRASSARVVLYRNNHDGTFTDVTTQAGIEFRGLAMAVAWGDYDHDGHIDLLITAYGHNVLYRNNGDGTFRDVSASTGIGGPGGFWTGAAWGDYDRDGCLDLYVTGYVKYTRDAVGRSSGTDDVENPATINPVSFAPERNLLFHNTCHGTFTEVAHQLGVDDVEGRGLVAAWVDLDNDGWPDLYVGNDNSNNHLYRNRGNGTFEDVSERAHVLEYRSSMGIAVGDWNSDGYQDLFLTHWLAQGNALYDNLLGLRMRGDKEPPSLTFADEADEFGLGQSSLDYVGWAASFIDYDNDGKLDLFVVNGSTLQNRAHPTQLVPMPSKLYWNRGPNDGFYDVSSVSGSYFGQRYVGRGAAIADYDNDGAVDAFVVNNGGPGILLHNSGGNKNHWLAVKLRGTKSNTQGIGASIRVVAGGRAQVRQVGAQAPYLSQNSLVETFGLAREERVDTIEVRWPSGARQLLLAVAANQRLTVVEGQDSAPVQTANHASVAAERDRVQGFWRVYREATTQRVAGQIPDAVASYARALSFNPDHVDALYYFGSLKFATGHFTEAAAAWRHLVAVDPSSGKTHSQLGALFMCLDDGAPRNLDSAEAHLRAADALYREQTGIRLRLGELALARRQFETARQRFEDVLHTDSHNAQALFYAGYLAWKRGDTVSARKAFADAAAASPPPATARTGLLEGDTKTGAVIGTAQARCDALRAASTLAGGSVDSRLEAERFRRLEALLDRYH